MSAATKYRTTTEVEAMQWSGSRESIDAICAWTRAKLRDDQADGDPIVDYVYRGALDVEDPLVDTPSGHEELKPGDWVVHVASDAFLRVDDQTFKGLYEEVRSG